jgi:D-arabinose 1-dehydrogenase-like Zn-dependent alcohol dehydrogenase
MDKKELSIKLGAYSFIDTSAGETANKLREMGGARVIICTAPNSQAITELIDGLGRNGQIIIVSAPQEMMQFNPGLLLRGNRSIIGSVSGNIEEAINFSLLTNIIPMVEFYPLEQAGAAFNKMMSAKVRFRAVLKIS